MNSRMLHKCMSLPVQRASSMCFITLLGHPAFVFYHFLSLFAHVMHVLSMTNYVTLFTSSSAPCPVLLPVPVYGISNVKETTQFWSTPSLLLY